MIRIKYVGAKIDGERAFKELTGIEWMPPDENDVQDAHAEMMLKHPDVFERAETQPEPVALVRARGKAKAEPVPETPPEPVAPKPGVTPYTELAEDEA
jgi:hypothetical protein